MGSYLLHAVQLLQGSAAMRRAQQATPSGLYWLNMVASQKLANRSLPCVEATSPDFARQHARRAFRTTRLLYQRMRVALERDEFPAIWGASAICIPIRVQTVDGCR